MVRVWWLSPTTTMCGVALLTLVPCGRLHPVLLEPVAYLVADRVVADAVG